MFYALFTDPGSCPVQLFKLYLDKLNPECDALWQKPRQGFVNYSDPTWYEARLVGRDMCERFMKLNLTKSVKLDGDYTNHSIRSTVINHLDTAGFEARHIIKLSSHKSEATVKEYATKCPENKRREMFDSLSSAIQLKPKPSATSTMATNPPVDPDIKQLTENLPAFDIQPLEDFETIDDSIFANLMYDMPKENSNPNTNNNNSNIQTPTVTPTNTNIVTQYNRPQPQPQPQPQQQMTPQFNTQVINQNMQNLPRFPAMYFPNSNVTINYQFGK